MQKIIDQEKALEEQAQKTADALKATLESKDERESYAGNANGVDPGTGGSGGDGTGRYTDMDVSSIHGNVSRGQYDQDVEKLQHALTDLGYDVGGIDGVFGAKTEAAVKAFQQQEGIQADGVVGPETKKKFAKYEKHAKGTLGVNKSDWAWIDDVGEELVLHADGSGKLSYLTKGTSVIPADLTSKLMDLALDPTQTLENSRPVISAPHIVNNEINIDMSIAEVVHIDTVTNDTIPDLTKAIEKQMDKYMKGLNNQIRKYAR